jgi:hypothetical protein
VLEWNQAVYGMTLLPFRILLKLPYTQFHLSGNALLKFIGSYFTKKVQRSVRPPVERVRVAEKIDIK